MGIFTDIMDTIELGERIAKGEAEAVKDEILEQLGEQIGAAPEAAQSPCDKAPPGYRCLGKHDDKGRCLELEVTE